MTLPRILYFIDRAQDRPEHHQAPYHRYLLCTDRKRAEWEGGDGYKGCWVWQRSSVQEGGEGFLIVRWKGLVIDYGALVKSWLLPDGTPTGFVHPSILGEGRWTRPPWSLLSQAVWWSDKTIPMWLCKLGVDLPADDFSRQRMREKLDFMK